MPRAPVPGQCREQLTGREGALLLPIKSGHPGACLVYLVQGRKGKEERAIMRGLPFLAAHRGVGITSGPHAE